MESQPKMSWIETIKQFKRPTVLTMLFLGFSAGLPLMLVFSSLSIWLTEAGVNKSSVTFFSWAALAYSFKFIWAPLVDQFPLPGLTPIFGRRRSWILLTQFGIIAALIGMALTGPQTVESSLTVMALFTVLLGFSSATQDIVIDAYRIESDSADMQALLSSTYMMGYRIGMLMAGAGALFLATWFGAVEGQAYNYSAWKWTYFAMAASMLVGVITTLIIKEPKSNRPPSHEWTNFDYSRFLVLFFIGAGIFASLFFVAANHVEFLKESLAAVVGENLGGFIFECLRFGSAVLVAVLAVKVMVKAGTVKKKMVEEIYVEPVKDFFTRYGQTTALILLSLIGLYRISDIVLGVISNVFYVDIGFSKVQIGAVVKTFGVVMSIVGALVGGVLTVRYGVIRMLWWGAILSAGTNLLFLALAHVGESMPMLYVVISADNLAAGLASAAFIAFLSSLTNVSFTASQYAIFSSLMTLFPKVIGGYSGTISQSIGYSGFFIVTTLMGLPVLFLIWLAGRHLDIQGHKTKDTKENGNSGLTGEPVKA